MRAAIIPPFIKRGPGRDINFLPPGVRLARRRRRNILLGGFTAVAVLACLFVLYTYPESLIKNYERRLEMHKSEVSRLEGGKEVFERLEAKKAKYGAMRSAVQEIDSQRLDALKVMEEIAGALPAGVYVSRLSLEPQKVSLTVISQNPIDTARVLVSLRRLGIFREVELSGAPLLTEPKEVSFDLVFSEKGLAAAKKPAGELMKVVDRQEKVNLGQQ